MNGLYYFIALIDKEGPGGFFLFGKDGHGGVAIDFGENVDVSFPNVLLEFELLKKESHEYVHLGLDVFFDFLQFHHNLLNFWDQVTTVTCFSR
jgi:hypothetical protein